MVVVKRSHTPAGVPIQLEAWGADHMIGAYPIAKRSSSRWSWPEAGREFRLSISTDEPDADFEALESGKKSLEDFAPRFRNGESDAYYLGISGEETRP